MGITASPDELRRYEESVRSEVERLLSTLSGPGRHSLQLVGEHPETVLVVTGPGLKSVDHATWRFELWGSLYEPFAAVVGSLDDLLEEIPHQIVLAGMAK